MMRGIGFLELMSTLAPGDPKFARLSAGMLVVRAADTLLYESRVDARMLADLQREVAHVRHLPARARLAKIVSHIGAGNADALANDLFVYGIELHEDGFYPAANDVFALLAGCRHVDPQMRVQSLLRQGFALRIRGKLDDAALAYEEARTRCLTAAMGRVQWEGLHRFQLEAELGLAKITADRGDMKRAREMTHAVARNARRTGVFGVYGRACIDLARLAGIAHEPLEVIRHANIALEHLTENAPCERARANIAQAFRELGAHESAMRVATRVACDAASADQRANAALLLYHLAIDEKNWNETQRLRGVLARTRLTPVIAAEYYEAIAREAAARGDFDDAMLHATRMLSVAESERLNEIAVRAETAIAALARGDIPVLYRFQPDPPRTAKDKRTLRRFEASIAK